RQLVAEDCEVRAIHAAQVAATALLRMGHVRGVITLSVKSMGERQYVSGTELHAETAGLTALHDDLHRTFGHLLPFPVVPFRRQRRNLRHLSYDWLRIWITLRLESSPSTERCFDFCPCTAQG